MWFLASGAGGSAASGDVSGPGASTDNALVRWNGTGGTDIQNGVLTSADLNGDLTGPTSANDTSAVGSAFTNQPANDGVTIVSDDAGDTTQTVTIIGTTNGTDTVVTEDIALNGVTPVNSVKVDWGVVLAVEIDAACAGTMTVSETSGGLAIVAITTGNTDAGIDTTSLNAWNRAISIAADGATTKQVGIVGTNSAGATIYDSQALSGTTAVSSNSAFSAVTGFLIGDVEGTRTVTFTTLGGTKIDGQYVMGAPSSSTDNAVARFDGATGKLLQNSAVTIADTTGSITGPASSAWTLSSGSGGALNLNADSSTVTLAISTYTQMQAISGGRIAFPSDVSLNWTSTGAGSGYASVGTPDTGLARSAAGVVKGTDGSAGIRFLQGGGTAVASATAMPVPTGRVFHVTGTTDITSITSTNFQAGAVITLIFDDVLTFTDGNNLVLAGNFVTSADDTITLAYDGTNWYECCRSAN